MQKEAVVLVVDVGRSMGQIMNAHSNVTGLDNAKAAIRLMIQNKLLFTKQDEMGVILVGTDETENELNEEQQGAYEHVRVLKPIMKPDLSFLESIDEIDVEDSEGDVIDALLVAMAMLHNRVKKLKFAKRIFLITDAAGPIVDDPDAFDSICQGLVNDHFKVNIIGINFSEEDDQESDADQPRVKREEEQKEQPHARSESSIGRTGQQIANEKLLRELAHRVDGVCFNVHSAIDMLSYFKTRAVHPVPKFRGDFEITPWLKVQAMSFGKTMMMNMPSLKKMALPSATSASDAAEDVQDAADVRMERVYINKIRDKEVPEEKRVKGFRYGKDLVPFTDEEMQALKFESERGIKVLSFVPKDRINRFQFMGAVDYIIAQPGDLESERALSAFIHAMYETDKVAIIRYVKQKNKAPLLGVLIPIIRPDFECFCFNQLPFSEDCRDFSFAGFSTNPAHNPTESQKRATRDLIERMDLMHAATDDDGNTMEALSPLLTFNPVLQRFYQCVQRRAMDPSAPIEELDETIRKFVSPDPSLLVNATPAIEAFQQSFTLRRQEKKEGKERKHWRDYMGGSGDDAKEQDNIDPAFKRVKVEGAGEGEAAAPLRFDDMLSAPSLVDKIGSVHPVSDFQKMLQRRDDATVSKRALEQMQKLIMDMVQNSYGDTQFGRAIECLRALRKGCVELEEADTFNRFLRDLQTAFATKRASFWAMVADSAHAGSSMDVGAAATTGPDAIYPISTDEVSDSKFSPDAAAAFFGHISEESSNISLPSVQRDADDLFESMD